MNGRAFSTGVALLWLVNTVSAHGINGHINVTHWMTADEDTHRTWREPGCRNAMVFGSSFPDTGYGVNHEYGELTHWAPFLDGLIAHLRRRSSSGGDRLVHCFTVGLAVHGLQDEMFDTFFLEQVATNDHVGQEIVDPGLDAIMVVDGVAQVKPEIFVPEADIISVLKDDFGVEVTPALIGEASRRVKLAVIDHFGPIAQGYADEHRASLGWAIEHYLSENVVGSLASEIQPTGAYAAAVWDRLRGQPYTADIVSSFGGNSINVQGDVPIRVYGLVLSRAAQVRSVRGGLEGRVMGTTNIEPFVVKPGIWTQDDDAYTRVLRIEVPMDTSLADYEFRTPAQWDWIDGSASTEDWYRIVPEVTPSTLDTLSEDFSKGGGCRVAKAANRPSGGIILALLLVCFSVRRLQS